LMMWGGASALPRPSPPDLVRWRGYKVRIVLKWQ
jgi:hypothetical protein